VNIPDPGLIFLFRGENVAFLRIIAVPYRIIAGFGQFWAGINSYFRAESVKRGLPAAFNSPFLPNMRYFTVLHIEAGITTPGQEYPPPYWFIGLFRSELIVNSHQNGQKRAETDGISNPNPKVKQA